VTDGAVPTKGRHRSAAADEAILAATVELLRESGYRGLTMSAVIERSGVSSATLYRRWSTKQALVVAALRTIAADPCPPDTGSLAGDLELLVKRIAKAIAGRDSLYGALSTEVPEDDEVRAMNREAFIEPRLEQVRQILDRAEARGELGERPADDVALSLVTGPLYHRALVLDEKLTPAFLKRVVEQLLAGFGR
jgi:AcrR family transcriptional regulator